MKTLDIHLLICQQGAPRYRSIDVELASLQSAESAAIAIERRLDIISIGKVVAEGGVGLCQQCDVAKFRAQAEHSFETAYSVNVRPGETLVVYTRELGKPLTRDILSLFCQSFCHLQMWQCQGKHRLTVGTLRQFSRPSQTHLDQEGLEAITRDRRRLPDVIVIERQGVAQGTLWLAVDIVKVGLSPFGKNDIIVLVGR